MGGNIIGNMEICLNSYIQVLHVKILQSTLTSIFWHFGCFDLKIFVSVCNTCILHYVPVLYNVKRGL